MKALITTIFILLHLCLYGQTREVETKELFDTDIYLLETDTIYIEHKGGGVFIAEFIIKKDTIIYEDIYGGKLKFVVDARFVTDYEIIYNVTAEDTEHTKWTLSIIQINNRIIF